MHSIFDKFADYLRETKKLNQEYYDNLNRESSDDSIKRTKEQNQTPVEKKEKIAILLKSRIYKENLPKDIWLKNSQAVEERMSHYVCMPYQIGNCSYIGNGVAWTGYNLNNKRALQIAINQINYFLNDAKSLDEVVPKIIPTDYNIDFNSILFDGPFCYGMPRSYILYQTETKSGKRPQYPLIAFFNTAKGTETYADEFYLGELYYAINGELSKATVHCHKHGKFAEFIFSVVGRTFLISKINTLDKDGKLFTLYNCVWAFTDYIDFA